MVHQTTLGHFGRLMDGINMTNDQLLKEVEETIKRRKYTSREENIYRDGLKKGLDIALTIHNVEDKN